MAIDHGFYAKMVNHIWPDIPNCCLKVYMWMVVNTVSERTDEKGRVLGIVQNNYRAEISYGVIARDLKQGRSTVERAVKKLVEQGYILRERAEVFDSYNFFVADSYKKNNREEALRPELTEGQLAIREKKKAAKEKLPKEPVIGNNEIDGQTPAQAFDDFDDAPVYPRGINSELVELQKQVNAVPDAAEVEAVKEMIRKQKEAEAVENF